MKILFFSPYFYPYTSGLTIYPYKILNHLCRFHQITVLTFPHQKNLKNKKTNLNIIYLPYLFKISKGFISLQSLFYFFYHLRKNDIVFLNQPNFEALPLAFIAKLLRKKIISLFHCQVFLKPSFLNKIIEFFLNLSMLIQLKLSDKIIIYTKDYFQTLPYSSCFKEKIISILPPVEKLPVDKNFYQKIKKERGEVLVGFAGRISFEKGVEYLIEAIKEIKDKKISLLFAGSYGKKVVGENSYFLKIKKLLKEKKIHHQFLGNLKNSKLGAFYKKIDLLVLPSINQTEAFGMVQVEAMLLQTPVVASRLPGVKIPIKLTKMGILVEPKNSKQIAEAINKILRNRKKYSNQRLVENAQKIFDIKKVYKFYEKLFKEDENS